MSLLRDRAGREIVSPVGCFSIVAILLTFAPAHGATITVGAGEGLASIGEALARVEAGDVIEVREGTYAEHIVVPARGAEGKPLTIRAAPGERVVLDARGAEYGIRIASGGGWVTVEGLIVVRARHSGLYARPAHDIIVRRCTFARNGHSGLYMRDTDGVVVEHCVFHHNRVNGATFRGARGLRVSDCMAYLHPAGPGSSENFGIYVSGSEGGVFERNALFLNDKSGLRIVESPKGNVVRDNVAYLNGFLGIEIKARSRKHLYVNNLTVWNMALGVNLKNYTGDPLYTREIRVINNTMVGNRWTAVTVNDGAHDNFFRNNLLVGSPCGFSYDTRIGWERRDSDHNVIDCVRPIAQLGGIEAARALGLEEHSLVAPVRFASQDPFDFRLPADSPLHKAATDAGFGKVVGAPSPTWRGPRLAPVRLKVTGASGNVDAAQLTADGNVATTWNSGTTEGAWVEYEVAGGPPGPITFAIICPTISTRLRDGDLPGPFTIRDAEGSRDVLLDGELFIRRSGLARARGQCFELEAWPRSPVGPAALRLSSAKSSRSGVPKATSDRQAACPIDKLRLELHRAVDGNYNGQLENICLSEVMLIAAVEPLPESLSEFSYDDVAPVPTSALEAARGAELRPPASVPEPEAAREIGLLFYAPFEDGSRAACARGEAAIFCDGAEFMPGIAGKGMYLAALPGNVCSVAGSGNMSADAGTFSIFLKPLAAWNRETVGEQNYQFLMVARPNPKAELRLAYVGGAFQVVGGVAYNGPAAYLMRKPVELEAHHWYHVCLTWSKQAGETVLYLDGAEIGRARFSADFPEGKEIRIGCNTSTLQPMAVLDEVKVFDRALTLEEVRELALQLLD